MINRRDTLILFTKFAIKRAFSLFLVVIVSVYLTILISSRSVVIESELEPGGPIRGWFSGIARPTVRFRAPDVSTQGATVWETSLRLLIPGLLLNLGNSTVRYSFGIGASFNNVRDLIVDSLPRTLLLFGTANMLIFFSSLSMALVLTRKFGSRLEKFILALSPISTIPSWIYGVVIVVILARGFSFYQGGMLNSWPEEFSWDFVLRVFKFMAPAILAIFLSKFFQSVYSWRSFLLIFSGEDYLELAKAKGLPDRVVERRYLLRPALPNILTSFTMLLIAIWQEAIVIELFFNVRGIGHVFYNAIRYRDMATIVGLTVIFAYLLAFSVFILDLVHGIVDPRVRMTESAGTGKLARKRRGLREGLKELGRGRAREPRPKRVSPKEWIRVNVGELSYSLRRGVRGFGPLLRDLNRYPSAVVGLLTIMGLIGISIYAVSAIPYQRAVQDWNYSGLGLQDNPKLAFPEWINLFRRESLPKSIFLDSRTDQVTQTTTVLDNGWKETVFTFHIDYPYQGFPKNIILEIVPKFKEKAPHLSLVWHTPDGREIGFGDLSVTKPERYNFSHNRRLMRNLDGLVPRIGLFADPAKEGQAALAGEYELVLTALLFEEESAVEAELKMEGQVYGWAGTDHRGRDIILALLWGAPVALAFGLLGAFGTTFTTMLVAGVSAWFSGWVDNMIQRLTEVSMILPAFPILLIVYNFYWKSVWAILGVAVILGVFSGAIKTYRSIFLSVKEAPYIEAARTYGATNTRIIFRYLVPRILPVSIPQLIILIPTYVYLEATLAFLNMSDPVLPTWGKLIREGISNGGLDGAYHLLLMPAGILMLTGLAFLMVGYAFERVLNPRLRDI